jgi:hypothetical protein
MKMLWRGRKPTVSYWGKGAGLETPPQGRMPNATYFSYKLQ